MSQDARPTASASAQEQRLPPVAFVGTLALGLAIAGVTYITASLPKEPPLAPAIGLLAAAAAAVIANAVALARARNFAWRLFFIVFRWTILAYGLIAGLLMFVFIYNDMPARMLAFQIATLAIGAVDIPMILAFSVAKYQS
ncbi:MAG: hypothetical protein HY676_03360 [Chloroflexi bacterium]|nr:hypothetical protein [Chloroflexota bacterium]